MSGLLGGLRRAENHGVSSTVIKRGDKRDRQCPHISQPAAAGSFEQTGLKSLPWLPGTKRRLHPFVHMAHWSWEQLFMPRGYVKLRRETILQLGSQMTIVKTCGGRVTQGENIDSDFTIYLCWILTGQSANIY